MPNLGKMRKRYIKDQFGKMAGGGDLVSDREKMQFQGQARQQVGQVLGAQQQGLARATMAQTGGAPVAAGGLVKGTQALGQASANAAVAATSSAKQHADALRQQRAAAALGNTTNLIQERRANVSNAIGQGIGAVEAGASLLGAAKGQDPEKN